MKQTLASPAHSHRAPAQRDRRSPRAVQPHAATSATSTTATVLDVADGLFSLRCAGLPRTAHRAASCLLAPAPGDLVACLDLASDGLWIVAVLRQAQPDATLTLRTAGAMRIEAAALALCAPELALEGETIGVRATRLQVASDEAELLGGRLKVLGATLKVIGDSLSTVFDRVAHFSKHHLRTTEGLDRVHATQIEQQASQILRLSSEHTLVNGEKLVKARGAQIHFG